MAEGLKLVVGADISEAQQKLKQFVSEAGSAGTKAGSALATGVNKGAAPAISSLKNLGTQAKQTGKEITTGISAGVTSVNKLPVAAKAAIIPISKLGDSLETLRAKLGARQSFLNVEKDVVKIGILNKEIKSLEAEILRVQSIGAGGVNLGGVGQAATKGFSFLRQAAFVLPGIGVAGLLGGITEAVAGLFDFSEAADEATLKVRELVRATSEIASEAGAGTRGESAQVNALVAIVKDQTKSYQERNRALNDLKEINKSYFGDLSLESSQLGILTERANEYTKAIINQAVIKAFSDEIGKVAVGISKQSKELGKATSAVDQYQKKVKEANDRQIEGVPQPFSAQNTLFDPNLSGLIDAEKNLTKQEGLLRDLSAQYRDLTDSINKAVAESVKFRPPDIDNAGAGEANKAVDNLIKKAQQLAAFLNKTTQREFQFLIDPEDTKQQTFEKAKTFIQEALDPLERFNFIIKPKIQADIDKGRDELRTELLRSVGTVKLPDGTLTVIAKPKIQLTDFQKLSVTDIASTSLRTFDEIKKEFESTFSNAAKAAPVELNFFSETQLKTNDFLKPVQNAFRNSILELNAFSKKELANIDLLRGFTKAFEDQGLNVEIPVNFKLTGDPETQAKEFFDKFIKAMDVDKAVANINNIISQITVDAFSSIGEALGAALTGGDIGKVFQEFGNLLGSAVQAIGKQLISLGTVALAVKIAADSLFTNPALQIAAGVALVAVGAALKNVLSGGIKGFAEGGLVFGPTLGLIGEGRGTTRSNPEVIAPLDKLKGMLTGLSPAAGAVRVQVEGVLRGNNQILQNSRTQRSQRRLGV